MSDNGTRTYKGSNVRWFPQDYTVIDLETTGLSPEYDNIIEMAAVRVRNNEIVDTFSSLALAPGAVVSDFITELTGISQAMVDAAPDIVPTLQAYIEFIGNDVVVGHNVNFDVNFIYDNCERFLSKMFSNDYFDTCRMSRTLVPEAEKHSLVYLTDFLHIEQSTHHRALADCDATKVLFDILKGKSDQLGVTQQSDPEILAAYEPPADNPLKGKSLVFEGRPQRHTMAFYEQVAEKCGAKLRNYYLKNTAYIVLSDRTYKSYAAGVGGYNCYKTRERVDAGKSEAFSESQFCDFMGIPYNLPSHKKRTYHNHESVRAKDITTDVTEFDETHPLYGKVVVFTGKLERMDRKDAMQIVADLGGINGDSVTKKTNYLILGNNDYCASIKDGKSAKQKKAESSKLKGQDIEILPESVFYDMLDEENE